MFGFILNKHVLWLINISTEVSVVDLSNVSFIKILSKDKLEQILSWWNQSQLFQDSSKLLTGDVLAIGLIIVLELWLDQDSSIFNFSSNCFNHINHCGLLFITEVSSGL